MYDTYVAYSIYNSNLIHTQKKKEKEKSCLILQYLLLFVDTPLRWIERRIIALICVSDEVLVLTIPTVFIQKRLVRNKFKIDNMHIIVLEG